VSTAPPTIVMVVNKPELFTRTYERYLLNRLHEELPFEEVPIRLLIRERQRAAIEDVKARGRRAARAGEQAFEYDEQGARLIPAFDPRSAPDRPYEAGASGDDEEWSGADEGEIDPRILADFESDEGYEPEGGDDDR